LKGWLGGGVLWSLQIALFWGFELIPRAGVVIFFWLILDVDVGSSGWHQLGGQTFNFFKRRTFGSWEERERVKLKYSLSVDADGS